MSLDSQDVDVDESDSSLHAMSENDTPAETPISEGTRIPENRFMLSSDAAEVDSIIAATTSLTPGAGTSSSALAPLSELFHAQAHAIPWDESDTHAAVNGGNVSWPLSEIREARLLHHFVTEVSKFVGTLDEASLFPGWIDRY